MLASERRQFQRVTLPQPIRAFVGPVPVYVVDASISGLRVLHQAALPNVGTLCRLMFHWDIGPITVDCEVVHTMVQRRASVAGEKNTLTTGLRVLAADRQSEQRLREMVHVFSSKNSRPKSNGGNGGDAS